MRGGGEARIASQKEEPRPGRKWELEEGREEPDIELFLEHRTGLGKRLAHQCG